MDGKLLVWLAGGGCGLNDIFSNPGILSFCYSSMIFPLYDHARILSGHITRLLGSNFIPSMPIAIFTCSVDRASGKSQKKELDLSPVGAKIPCERLQLVMAEIDLAEVGGKEMLAGSASFEGCPGWGFETISPLYVEGWLLEIVSHFLLCREQY